MHLDSGTISGAPAAVTAKRQSCKTSNSPRYPNLESITELQLESCRRWACMQKMCADVEFRGTKSHRAFGCHLSLYLSCHYPVDFMHHRSIFPCSYATNMGGSKQNKRKDSHHWKITQTRSKGLYQEWPTGAYFLHLEGPWSAVFPIFWSYTGRVMKS